MQAADVERRELLERSGREVDAAGRAAGAAVRDEHGHGLAVGAGRGERLVADRVPRRGERTVSVGSGAGRAERGTDALGLAPAPGKVSNVWASMATMKSASVLEMPHAPRPAS